MVTVGGNVVLMQGKNVLKGDRLVIDLKTGESRFENTGTSNASGGRIRALFMPKGGLVKDLKPGEAKPDGAGPAAKPEADAGGGPPGQRHFCGRRAYAARSWAATIECACRSPDIEPAGASTEEQKG